MVKKNEAADDIFGIDEEGDLLPSFELKYKMQMRQIVTQRLDLPISTLPTMLVEQIKINPDFQRRDRWDAPRQSRLIESLLMNVPIPPVFLGEDEYGSYVVLDGRQRLTAIKKFMNNTLTLEGLSVWDDLNGLVFEDLVKRGIDKHLTRRFVSAIVILKESSSVVKYDVFDRLNTGGVKANEMEVRNAIFQGLFTEHLHELSRLPEFCDLWGIPKNLIAAESNEIYKKMHDLSIVLRFFALSTPSDMEGRFRGHLGEFMKSRNEIYLQNIEQKAIDKLRFDNAITNSWKIFGENAFRKPSKKKMGPPSIPLAEAVMIALSDISPEHVTPVIAEKIKVGLTELFHEDAFVKAISTGTNGKGAIQKRISMAREKFQSAFL